MTQGWGPALTSYLIVSMVRCFLLRFWKPSWLLSSKANRLNDNLFIQVHECQLKFMTPALTVLGIIFAEFAESLHPWGLRNIVSWALEQDCVDSLLCLKNVRRDSRAKERGRGKVGAFTYQYKILLDVGSGQRYLTPIVVGGSWNRYPKRVIVSSKWNRCIIGFIHPFAFILFANIQRSLMSSTKPYRRKERLPPKVW